MNEAIRDFIVTIEDAGEHCDVKVSADSARAAAKRVERDTGCQPIAVETEWAIIGRCLSCNGFVFEGDTHTRFGDRVKCADCG